MRHWCSVVFVGGLLVTGSGASGTVINVSGDQPTIQAGIDAAVEFCEPCAL